MKLHRHDTVLNSHQDYEHRHALEEEVSAHQKKIRKKLEEKLEHRRLKQVLEDFDEWH